MLRTLLAALTSLAGSSGAWAAGLDGRSSGDPTTWRETIDLVLEMVATGIEVTGVAIIVIAAVVSTALFVSAGISSIGWPQAFRTYRANLGRGILLGLELLVAADIIGTVAVTPSFENLAILGLIVLIRTFLSFSLEVEIEGRWPWQRAEAERILAPAPDRAAGSSLKNDRI
jgi:uncharacterized membrane protein